MLLTLALLSAAMSAPAQPVNPVVQWNSTLLGIVRTAARSRGRFIPPAASP